MHYYVHEFFRAETYSQYDIKVYLTFRCPGPTLVQKQPNGATWLPQSVCSTFIQVVSVKSSFFINYIYSESIT